MPAGRAGLTVDAEMVLSVPQSLELAKACATEGGVGGGRVFLCSSGFVQARSGEATGLLWNDVELPAGDEPDG